MKRKFTYLLLIIVVFVWGVVFYRLFFVRSDDKETVHKKEVTPVSKLVSQPYELIADYQDPFFERTTVKHTPAPQPNQVAEIYPIEEEQVQIPPLKYIGLIQNPATKKQITLINFEGKDFMLAKGETKHELTLLQTTDEYIEIEYKGIIKIIFK